MVSSVENVEFCIVISPGVLLVALLLQPSSALDAAGSNRLGERMLRHVLRAEMCGLSSRQLWQA